MLVKFSGAPERSTLSFGTTQFNLRIEPLFKGLRADLGPKDTSTPRWYVVRAVADDDEVNVWDVCHHLVEGKVEGLAVPEFAEPDIAQQWVFGPDSHHLKQLARTCEEVVPPDSRLPSGSGFYWFRDSSHSQLELARDEVGQPASNRVCIAHFDTGYDPTNCARPKFLRTDLQKNFVDDNVPDDATDITSGPFTNLGHGTGTLGILAGDKVEGVPLGGAAFLDVIPVRVANSVVLFWNSSIAKAFQYVHDLAATSPVQVITMSMGGLASQAWADGVNALYELGVFIVTAAGNNFGHLPTNNIVYPARFNRVVAACGVMADDSPYADLPLDIMAGNYGPDSKMSTAMAAFTPNTPWARIGCGCTVDHNGAGTSSATPQIAAAAALWIQKYQDTEQWSKYSAGWMRVEAVRKALFDSAVLPAGGMKRFGRGIIKAEAALHRAPAKEADLEMQPEDSPGFPLFRVINGKGATPTGAEKRMLELETLQLTQQSRELEQLIPDQMADPRNISPVVRRRFIEALASTPGASATLRTALARKATS
jgi:hypothetical protein